MKLRNLTQQDALPLLSELRAMAALEPGPDPKRLARANEIRFQLQGQEWASLWMREKLDEVYRFLTDESLFNRKGTTMTAATAGSQ